MKKMKVLAVVAACALCLSVFLVGCGSSATDEDAQTQVINDYYQALTDADFDAVVNCCDPTTQTAVENVTSLLQSTLELLGLDNVDVKSLTKDLYPAVQDVTDAVDASYKVAPTSIELTAVDDTHAQAAVAYEITVSAGNLTQIVSGTDEFDLVKNDNEWKINLSDKLTAAIKSSITSAMTALGL